MPLPTITTGLSYGSITSCESSPRRVCGGGGWLASGAGLGFAVLDLLWSSWGGGRHAASPWRSTTHFPSASAAHFPSASAAHFLCAAINPLPSAQSARCPSGHRQHLLCGNRRSSPARHLPISSPHSIIPIPLRARRPWWPPSLGGHRSSFGLSASSGSLGTLPLPGPVGLCLLRPLWGSPPGVRRGGRRR
jgi:hypothetical protein